MNEDDHKRSILLLFPCDYYFLRFFELIQPVESKPVDVKLLVTAAASSGSTRSACRQRFLPRFLLLFCFPSGHVVGRGSGEKGSSSLIVDLGLRAAEPALL